MYIALLNKGITFSKSLSIYSNEYISLSFKFYNMSIETGPSSSVSSSSSLKLGCLCHQDATAKLFKAYPFNIALGYMTKHSLNLFLASIKLPFNK